MVAGKVLARWRVRAGYPVALAAWVLAHPTPSAIAIGAGVAVLGLLVRGAAAGHLRKGQGVAASGPYSFTRNPLYLGSALLAAGFVIAGHSWIAAVLVAAYFVLFYPAVMRREEQELRAVYGAAFGEYAACVPRFWPRLAPEARGAAPFSWAQYRRNREYQAALGFLLGVALLWLRMCWPR